MVGSAVAKPQPLPAVRHTSRTDDERMHDIDEASIAPSMVSARGAVRGCNVLTSPTLRPLQPFVHPRQSGVWTCVTIASDRDREAHWSGVS
jgi:hypothetical protein